MTEGKRLSKEEMEEANEGREVGVVGGGVGMEEWKKNGERWVERRGVEERNKTLLFCRSI